MTEEEFKLREEIDELKFNARRRKEWHDDPVGAEELLERAREKEEELKQLLSR